MLDYKATLALLTPYLASLATVSFVVMVSNAFEGKKKMMFQTMVMCIMTAYSLWYLGNNDMDQVLEFWAMYKGMSYEFRFTLGLFTAGAAYFGGALYLSNVVITTSSNDTEILSTPATEPVQKMSELPSSLPEDDKKFFESMLKRFTAEIITDLQTTYEMPAEAVAWVRDMIFYTVDGGKMNRGLATVDVIRTLANRNGKTLTTQDRIEAAALGWCVEFLQAFFLVADDVMDGSITRRGQPCWYKRDDVKLIAINDSFILESCVFLILKRYFGSKSYYPQLTDIFVETTRQTELGQLLDLTSQRLDGAIDLSRFTIERYRSIVKYKTAFYSFYLPVALGMIQAGIDERSLYDKARQILCIMGEYFQIQDDVLDCFGAPEVIGKVGTDIQDNKCSWLVVQALNIANKKQLEVLEKNYGSKDPKNVESVKALYRDLELEKRFQEYEESSHNEIMAMIDSTPDLPREVFMFLLQKIYKRTK